MPGDLSKKISEVLNNKPISPEDEPADALEDMARDIALIEPNPVDWGEWMGYLVDLRHYLSLTESTEQFQFDAVKTQRSFSQSPRFTVNQKTLKPSQQVIID